MTPISLEEFMEILGVEKVTWTNREFREYDMQGTGHELDRRLAPDKWAATMVCRALYNEVARRIAAVKRKAQGAPFMIYDPSNPYPSADPNGRTLDNLDWVMASGAWDDDGVWQDSMSYSATSAAYTPQLASIGADGQSLSIKGLPPNYTLTTGDKGQIEFASGDRNYFFEVSQDVTAASNGLTTVFGVYPPIPVGVAVDAAINLKKPACKMRITAEGFSPGQSSGNMTFGTTIELLERV